MTPQAVIFKTSMDVLCKSGITWWKLSLPRSYYRRCNVLRLYRRKALILLLKKWPISSTRSKEIPRRL